MKAFMHRYADQVKGVLSGWDRLAFRGTLRWLANSAGLGAYLSDGDILLRDFTSWAQALTGEVRRSCEEVAASLGIRCQYLPSAAVNKEMEARRIAREEGIEAGPICLLSVVEPSYSPTVVRNRASKHLEIAVRPRKCVWLYFYFNDPQVGFGHLRLESWLPFTIKGCLNGRHWLEQSLRREGLAYIKADNCFRWVADPGRAQELAEAQLQTDWPRLLDGLVQRYFPVMNRLLEPRPVSYYWSVDESEWATDIMFQNTADLDRLFPLLARYGLLISDSAQVMRYLGQIGAAAALPRKIAGDVRGDRRRRHEGVCVKHRHGRNSVKVYNKAGNVLRVETTINAPRSFKAFRQPNDDPDRSPRWLPMRKGVADLHRRAGLSQASNERYLDALASCPSDATFNEIVGQVCQPIRHSSRRIRALNPSAGADLHLLRFLAQGQWAVEGFRNRDLAVWLDPRAGQLAPPDRRKLAARASRLLSILKAHGLIRRVSRTHRYLVTAKGHRVASLMIKTSTLQAETLMKSAS